MKISWKSMMVCLCALGVGIWLTFFAVGLMPNGGCGNLLPKTARGPASEKEAKEAGGHDDHDGETEAGHEGHGHAEAGKGKGGEDTCGDAKDGDVAGIVESPALETAGIEHVDAGPLRIGEELEGPGEIFFNEDRLAHVSPLVTCTAVEVLKSLGDVVKAGEPLAVMHSADLGAAQIEYLTMVKNLELAKIDLDRMRTINESTLKLLELLRQEATPDRIGEEMKGASAGTVKGEVLSRYAALRHADAAFARAKRLREGKVVSEGDFELATRQFESAKAEYQGTFEGTAFDTRDNLIKAEKTYQVAETSLLNVTRKLRNMGVSEEGIDALRKGNAADGLIARYELTSKIAGVVTSRHLAVGEHIEVDKEAREECFTVADLSTVWCDIRLSPADLDKVKLRQKVFLRAGGETLPGEGRVIAISPTIDENTRVGFARALFDNPAGKLRPGLYVDAFIESGDHEAAVAVPREALQTLDGRDVVFVKGSCLGEYEARRVVRGVSNKRLVEILSGVKAGERVVIRNAYVIKAELAKGSATGCAGGH